MRACLAVLALALLSGCIDDLPSGVVLERPRVLGARLAIDGDPGRAAPRPGEQATLQFFTAAPGDATWSAALTACVAAPSFAGVPGCQGEPFAVAPPGPPGPAPSFDFTVPDASAFAGGADAILFAGVLCADGTPSATLDEAMLPTCDGDAPTREVITFRLPVALGDATPNQHPTLDDETLTIDGATWALPDSPPATGCASAPATDALPRLTLQDEETPSEVVFTSAPEDREAYQELVITDQAPTFVDAREDITLTHLATAGSFERFTTEVFDDDAPSPRVEWTHPVAEDVPADGLTVRFVFVARDGRGGMDWTERVACVVP